MKNRLAKFIRVSTVAPVMALILCSVLYVHGGFANLLHYLMALLFLAVLPLLAYPVAAVIPALHKKGRHAERSLAIFFSVVGYIGGMVFSLCTDSMPLECVLYGTYLISGVLIAVFSLLHFRASGHACGVAGPAAMLASCVSPVWLVSLLLLAAVFWASLVMKRHTFSQLLAGSAVPVAALAISSLLFLIH